MTRISVSYWLILPAILLSGAVLGYYTYQTAIRFEQAGERSILQSTLLLVEEKVNRLEAQIIDADNAVFKLVDLSSSESIEVEWPELASSISPSVRSLVIFDELYNVVGYAGVENYKERLASLEQLTWKILPQLSFERSEQELKYLHTRIGGEEHLVSYRTAKNPQGRKYHLVAQHDLSYFTDILFPSLFKNESGKALYNVIDDKNRLVFGSRMSDAGEYLVARRFPTTLYRWRLQVVPQQAEQLKVQARTRRYNDVVLLVLCFVVMFFGTIVLFYAVAKERRLNALKTVFLANVSHELKTPLSIVRMFSDLLLNNKKLSSHKKQQYLEIISRESDRLTGLVENVLDFAALEHGKIRYQLRRCKLEEIVERAVETFRYRAESEGVDITFFPDKDLPLLAVDEQSIVLAVMNLLDNAVKYGEKGLVEVRLRRMPQELVLQVRDHGPGIAEEELKKIFERFYRAAKKKPEARGSGIGLSLVRFIAEAHGGRAWAENAEGGGAIVSLAFPIPKSETKTEDLTSTGSTLRAQSDGGSRLT